MNLEQLFAAISANQGKLVRALLDHPEGLLSNELAKLTAVSNKSATMTQDVRELLEEHGLELIIERSGGASKWVLRKTEKHVPISESNVLKVFEALDEISRICQEVKLLLC